MRDIAKKLVFGANPISVYEMEGGNLARVVDFDYRGPLGLSSLYGI